MDNLVSSFKKDKYRSHDIQEFQSKKYGIYGTG
jgi:hypothetical protein